MNNRVSTDASYQGNIDRRRLLTAGAWAVPAVALAVSTPLAAATGPGVPGKTGLRFTHFGGSKQWGKGWGSPGDFIFNIGVYSKWNTDGPASITVTIYHEQSNGEFVLVSGYVLAPDGEWEGSQFKLNVPGWVPGKNKFIVVVQAPGFETIMDERIIKV